MEYKLKRSNPVTQFLRNNLGQLIALCVLVTAISIISPYFLTSLNFKTLLLQITTTTIVGFGMTCLLISGNIDLSVGSTYAFSGVVMALLLEKAGISFPLALLLTLVVCAALGAMIGTVVANTAIPAFILTMAMMGITRGLAYVISDSQARVVTDDKAFITIFGTGSLLKIPNQLFIIVVVGLILWFILEKTVLGRHIYAVGGNKNAAEYSGVNTKKITIIAYIIVHLCACLAGLIAAARVSSGQPSGGADIMGDCVAAAVIGGTAFGGGRGTIVGSFLGCLIIGVILNAMNLLGVSYYAQLILKGLLVVFAIYVDTIKQSKVGQN